MEPVGPANVRFLKDAEALEVEGHGRIEYHGYDELLAPLATLAPASLASLRRAAKGLATRYEDDDGSETWSVGIDISEVAPEDLDGEYSLRSATELFVAEEGVWVIVREVPCAGMTEDTLDSTLRPYLERERCCDVDIELGGADPNNFVTVSFRPPYRGRTAGDSYRIGAGVERLIDALAGEGLDSVLVLRDLLAAGQADLLIGQAESGRLEVKRQPHDLDTLAGKIELAQDVARFANAEDGGILILGVRTRRDGDQEFLAAVRPFARTRSEPNRVRRILDDRVFPPIDALEVEFVEVADGLGYLYILVPGQSEDLKPFLVHGAVVAGRAEGAFISIVRRRGDQSIPISGPAIHAWLSAGRALLKEGRLPEERST